jgi:hypothetical protein
MTWAAVCFVAGLVAEQAGSEAGAIYLIALSVGAIALAMMLTSTPPKATRSRQSASWRRPQ